MKKIILSVLVLSSVFVSCKKSTTNNNGNGNTTPTITDLSCSSAVFSTTSMSGLQYAGSATVGYIGGNGVAYTAGTAVASTGVTGLTATLQAGSLASGNGNLSFVIAGTPTSAGTANFPITFGGKSCTLTLNVAQAPLFMNANASDKWYVQSEVDSAFCCLSTYGTSAFVAYPDSNITYPGGTTPADMDYMQFLPSKAYSWYWYSATAPTTYSGTYTYGYSSITGADSITTTFQYNGSPLVLKYRINSVNSTTMNLRNRSFYYPSTGMGVMPNGDTLLYRWTYNLTK